MSQIYVSGPWSFASGVLQVVKSIKTKSKAGFILGRSSQKHDGDI